MRTLCKGALEVRIGRRGNRILLEIKNSHLAAFVCEPDYILTVEEGATIQVSSSDGWCEIRPDGGRAHISFSASGCKVEKCSFPLNELCNVLHEQAAGD